MNLMWKLQEESQSLWRIDVVLFCVYLIYIEREQDREVLFELNLISFMDFNSCIMLR